ncbi:unnamed protein product [Mycena citricolor]|uniref:AB hydrolase-1 domain-containing protein n=1 Tax=Mycena citricolor TaxID=2018698 RepID=A0AAD2HL31_9AGAR|nr:unnamed protein product [Mycena citricolor]
MIFSVLKLLSELMGVLLSIVTRTPTHMIQIHYGEKPASIEIRQPDGSSSEDNLKNLVEKRVPSLFSKFDRVWYLFNGHLQTLYCVLGDFTKTDVVQYNRKLIRLKEGGTLGLDFAPSDSSLAKEDAPIIVVLHGLTGGKSAHHDTMIAFLHHVVRILRILRAGVPVSSPQLYSAGFTGDIREALVFISQLYPRAPLLGLGFSLGANVLTRYLAEEGENSRLVSGCVLACPWDLSMNNEGLKRNMIGRVYSRAMATNLINIVKKHEKSLSKDPNRLVAQYIPVVYELQKPLLEEFDENFTRIAGGAPPDFPYASARDYYLGASCHKVVSQIQVPFLAVNADDDPVVQHVPMDGGGNGKVVMALTASGGHLGWFQKGPHSSRWITKPVLEWLVLCGDHMVHSHLPRGIPVHLKDGFYVEEGRDGGCREIEGGGLVDATSWAGMDIQGL